MLLVNVQNQHTKKKKEKRNLKSNEDFFLFHNSSGCRIIAAGCFSKEIRGNVTEHANSLLGAEASGNSEPTSFKRIVLYLTHQAPFTGCPI